MLLCCPGENSWEAAELGGDTHHVGVRVVNERLLEAVVEDDDDGMHQVAGVTDAGQEAPHSASKQLVYQTCREQASRVIAVPSGCCT